MYVVRRPAANVCRLLRVPVRWAHSGQTSIPGRLSRYVQHNNVEAQESRWSLSHMLALAGIKVKKEHEGQEAEEEYPPEGDVDIQLGSEDSLHQVDALIRRSRLFTAVEELRQSVKLRSTVMNWTLPAQKDEPELQSFLDTFQNLFTQHKYLSAISAAETATKRLPAFRHITMQCRAFAMTDLAVQISLNTFTSTSVQVRVNSLLRAAASDLDAALAAQPSAEIANRYYTFATHIGTLGDPDSLALAKEMISFLSAKTSSDMKDTHMRLVNVSGVYTTQLAHAYGLGSHFKYRHTSSDAFIRHLFFSVINNFTHSLQEHVYHPPRFTQQQELLAMLELRSKLWMTLEEKERALSDLNLVLECETTDDRLLRRANIYQELKDYKAAIADVTKVAGKAPFENDLNWLAILYELNKQSDKALLVWRYVVSYLPIVRGNDSYVFSRVAAAANHAHLYELGRFAATEGLDRELKKKGNYNYELICDLYTRRAWVHYHTHAQKQALEDISAGLTWYHQALDKGKDKDKDKGKGLAKAAAELYFLRGAMHVFDKRLKHAFEDFDTAVALVPSMIQRVKEFQDNITVSKSHRYIYIDRNEVISVAVVCVGIYIGFVLLSK